MTGYRFDKRDYDRRYLAQRREQAKLDGRCIYCLRRPAEEPYVGCVRCRERLTRARLKESPVRRCVGYDDTGWGQWRRHLTPPKESP